jgi:GGDEF domain-containing protein
VWVGYILLAVIYSLWALRLTRSFSDDRRLGYLLCLTDGTVLLPLMVWNSAAAMQAILVLIWAVGLFVTYSADRARKKVESHSPMESRSLRSGGTHNRPGQQDTEAPLERALRVRLRVLSDTNTRFALVMLRVLRFEEIGAYYGEDAAEHILAAVSRRGLRLLGPDAQLFVLQGGRVAFVFATGTGVGVGSSAEDDSLGWIDPYDVESVAMTVGRRACEHLVDGHRVECVVGWASAPADGMTADDLAYAAESGAQSTAAFRRVAGSRVPVPEKTRVAAG